MNLKITKKLRISKFLSASSRCSHFYIFVFSCCCCLAICQIGTILFFWNNFILFVLLDYFFSISNFSSFSSLSSLSSFVIFILLTFPIIGTKWCSHKLKISMSLTRTTSSVSSRKTAFLTALPIVSSYPLVKNIKAFAALMGVSKRPSLDASSPKVEKNQSNSNRIPYQKYSPISFRISV